MDLGDWGSDCAAAVDMAMEAATKLQELDPTHELLQYVCQTPAEIAAGGTTAEHDAAVHQAFKDRFWDRPVPWVGKPGVIVTTVVYANYWVALQAAVAEAQRRAAQPPTTGT